MLDLSQIESRVLELASKIGATKNHLPTYGETRDLGYTHVEVSDGSYHLVTVERGAELERRSTSNLSHLLYLIFSDATFCIASDYELKNRIKYQDSRRLLFTKQIELMYAVDEEFGKKEENRISAILSNTPYNYAL